jgi:hypothetical protein
MRARVYKCDKALLARVTAKPMIFYATRRYFRNFLDSDLHLW